MTALEIATLTLKEIESPQRVMLEGDPAAFAHWCRSAARLALVKMGLWPSNPAGGLEQDRGAAAIRPAGSTERCVGFEPHPFAIYANEYCVAPVYGSDGRPHYCGRPRSEHQS